MYKLKAEVPKIALFDDVKAQRVIVEETVEVVDQILDTVSQRTKHYLHSKGGYRGNPISDTGTLAGSIHKVGPRISRDRIRGRVASDAEHFATIELGRRVGKPAPPLIDDPFPVPKRARKLTGRKVSILVDWVRRRRLARDPRKIRQIAYLIGRKLSKRGFKGYKFTEKVLKELEPEIRRALESIGLEVAVGLTKS